MVFAYRVILLPFSPFFPSFSHSLLSLSPPSLYLLLSLSLSLSLSHSLSLSPCCSLIDLISISSLHNKARQKYVCTYVRRRSRPDADKTVGKDAFHKAIDAYITCLEASIRFEHPCGHCRSPLLELRASAGIRARRVNRESRLPSASGSLTAATAPSVSAARAVRRFMVHV